MVLFPIIIFFYFSVKRLLDFLRQIISSQHKEPLKVPPGFSAVERELSQLCGRFLRLIDHQTLERTLHNILQPMMLLIAMRH